MTIAMLIDFKGATAEQYDRVIAQLHLKGKTPPGGVFHVAGATEDGFRVIDVWKRQEDFDRFYETKLRTAIEEAGLDLPEVSAWQVHNTLTPIGPVHAAIPTVR